MKKEKIISILIKLIAIAASVYGLLLSYGGEKYFTFFTNLSNIAVDIVLVISLVYIMLNKKPSNQFYLLKFLSTVSIMLTFLIFLCVLAPTSANGFLAAYTRHYCGSLGVHFVGPLLAIIDFIAFDKEFISKKIYTLYAIVPPLIYVIFIIILGQCFNYRWNDTMYAPYNFINYGAKCGWFGFQPSTMDGTTLGIGVAYMIVVLCIIFILLGLLLLWLNGLRNINKSTSNKTTTS